MSLSPLSLSICAIVPTCFRSHAGHAAALWLCLALAACGGGDDAPAPPPAAPQDTLQFQPRDTVVAMQPADTASVVTVTPQANGDPTQISVGFSGTGPQAAVGQILAIPPNAERGLPLGFTGKVEAIKQGVSGPEYVLKPAALTEVYKNLNLDFDSSRGGMQIAGVIGPTGKISMARPDRARAQAADVTDVGSVTNEKRPDGSINMNLSVPFELPLTDDGSVKMYVELTGSEVVMRQGVKIVDQPCSGTGCTIDNGRSIKPVVTANQTFISGKFNATFGVRGARDKSTGTTQTVKNIGSKKGSNAGISWDELERSFGNLSISGLDGTDKEGLYPIGGVILAPGVANPFVGDNPPRFDALKNFSTILWFYVGVNGEVSVAGDLQMVNVEVPVNVNAGFTDDGATGEAIDNAGYQQTGVTIKSALKGWHPDGVPSEGELDAPVGSVGVDLSLTVGMDGFVGGIRPMALRFDAFAYHIGVDISAEDVGIQWYPTVDKPFSGGLCYSASHSAVSGRFTVIADVEIGKKFKNGGWAKVDRMGHSVPEFGGELTFRKDVGGYDWMAGKWLQSNELPLEKNLGKGCVEVTPTDLAVDVSLNPDQTSNAQMATYRLDISRSGAFTKTNATSLKVIDQWVEGNDEIPVELFTDPANGHRYGVINLYRGATHALKISAVSEKFGDLSASTTAEVKVPNAFVAALGVRNKGVACGDVSLVAQLTNVPTSATPLSYQWWVTQANEPVAPLTTTSTDTFPLKLPSCVSTTATVTVTGADQSQAISKLSFEPSALVPVVTDFSPSSPVQAGTTVTVQVVGRNLPLTAILAVAEATCATPTDRSTTGFKQSCTMPFAVGDKAVQIKTDTSANGGEVIDSTRAIKVVGGAPTTSKLPHSGITSAQCYQAGSNNLVACNSPGAIALSGAGKQDGMLADVNPMSYGNFGSYSKEECVMDNVTKLMWEGKTASGTRAGSNTYTNFGDGRAGDASAYVAAVNAQGLCGFNDWRLPTVDELQSIVDYSKPYPGPTINSTWFLNTPAYSYYWSSSPYAGNSSYAWSVYFYYGYVNGYGRFSASQVRLVRASQ